MLLVKWASHHAVGILGCGIQTTQPKRLQRVHADS
jgi:hypothetical protein